MRLESIEEVQSQVFREILGFEELPIMASALSDTAIGAASMFVDRLLLDPLRARKAKRGRRMEEDVALGTAAGTSETDVRLAVLVQNQRFLKSAVIDRIATIARGEVDVVYIGRQQPLWMQTRHRPVRMGASVSPAGVGYSGTLGLIARSSANGRSGIVSNNHVLAGVNSIPLGTDIIQAAGGDGGRHPRDVIARLSNFIPILFGGATNAVDAAFAELANGIDLDSRNIWDASNPPIAAGTFRPDASAVVLPGLNVMKTGRTTGHTRGVVRAINVNNYTVNMGPLGVARFDGQVLFESMPGAAAPFSRAGDSGSMIADTSGAPVALLFAGSQSGGNGNLGITGGNPISSVFSQLGVVPV
ncbi:MAG: hypothetical protein KL863_22905 [Rhizobium sp.]|nr:hypothetical protein [Rhizobium sp.]